MNCDTIRDRLGRYLDGELPAETVGAAGAVTAPPGLWEAVEAHLDGDRAHRTPFRRAWWTRGAWGALAAVIALSFLFGVFGTPSRDTEATASSVDFRVLLDTLPLDPQRAFRKFLIRYEARPVSPAEARRAAASLRFDVPEMLPGGFRLQQVYLLRFGDYPGVAAAYDRHGEFLAAVFHPPVNHERFGPYTGQPCVIGSHCGHKVEIGEWKLVHLTDPTTCHCVLSRLDEKTELPAILSAIASPPADAPTPSPPSPSEQRP